MIKKKINFFMMIDCTFKNSSFFEIENFYNFKIELEIDFKKMEKKRKTFF